MPESGPSSPAAISDMDEFCILGIAAAVLAVILLIRRIKGTRVHRLIGGGRFVWAEITGCDGSYLVNGKSYCCFRAKYRDEIGTEHQFLSDAVRTHKVYGKTGWKVRVYLAERGYEDYYVDPGSICQEK